MARKGRRAASPEEELTEYEVIRKRNMEEIQRAMAKSGTFKEIQELSHQIKNNTTKKPKDDGHVAVAMKDFGVRQSNLTRGRCKNSNVIVQGKKKASEEPVGEKRRALRKRQDEDDKDYEPPKNLRLAKKDGINYNESAGSDESSDNEINDFKRKRGLPRRAAVRAARKMSYAEIYIPSADEFIFCDYPECQDEYFEGCAYDDHEVAFIDEVDARIFLRVKDSLIPGGGRGVFNGHVSALEEFEETIPMGIIFGPYGGPIIDIEEYESKRESGYAWELMDPEKRYVIGYVDPGHDGPPDPIEYIFALINSANCKEDQNIVSFQYRSQIVYRVCKEIPPGKELLTYYGDKYSEQLGINPENYHAGKKKYACNQCERSFRHQPNLSRHIWAAHKNRKFGCLLCDYQSNYKGDLKQHIEAVHEKVKYRCHLCCSEFSEKGTLNQHIATVHQKLKLHHCSVCDKKFGQKGTADRHYKLVHLGMPMKPHKT